jgi:acyl-CoA oxidase
LLARSVVLILGHNAAQDLFANPKGREFEQIKVFCITKCMVTWHAGETASVCRERCGGGGYLHYNVVSSGVEGAHSGMTAEGDNRVLM